MNKLNKKYMNNLKNHSEIIKKTLYIKNLLYKENFKKSSNYQIL